MKIPPRSNPDVDNTHSGSRQPPEAGDSVRPCALPIDATKISTPRLTVDGIITIRLSRSLPAMKDLNLPVKGFRAGSATPAPAPTREPTLTDNLLKLLSIGSMDSLNVLLSMFEFHQYDEVLLKKYLDDKSPDNLKALQRHINSRAEASPNIDRGAGSQP